MKTNTVRDALQLLVIRLTDAEKAYLEIAKLTSNHALKEWCERYASERNEMHKLLEGHIAAMGGDAEVRTSYLGQLHRAMIDMKISGSNNEFQTIVDEIERGATTLISEYDSVLQEMEIQPELKNNLIKQKTTIQLELNNLVALREEFNSIPA